MHYAFVLLLQAKDAYRPQPVPLSCDCPGSAAILKKRISLIATRMLGIRAMTGLTCSCSTMVRQTPVYHVSPENKMIMSEPYGAILEIEIVFVLHNPKHDAYNMVVSRNIGIVAVK